MPLDGSSFLNTLPYRTRALTPGSSLGARLPADSEFRGWASALQDYLTQLTAVVPVPWGSFSPADVLLDTGRFTLLDPVKSLAIRQHKTGKIVSTVSRGLGALTTALLLYDYLVWSQGDASLQDGVPRRSRQGTWIGKWPIIEDIHDLSLLMSGFIRSGRNLTSIADEYLTSTVDARSQASPAQAVNWVAGMVTEYSSLISGQRALTATKNIIYIAFCIRAMIEERQITVPEDIFSRLDPSYKRNKNSLVNKDVHDLRNALLAALAISPLIVLGPKDLCNNAACPEETIMNCRNYGSDKPTVIVSLERTTWREVLKVAKGNCSAIQAFKNLQSEWKDVDWSVVLVDCKNYFKLKQDEVVDTSSSVSSVPTTVASQAQGPIEFQPYTSTTSPTNSTPRSEIFEQGGARTAVPLPDKPTFEVMATGIPQTSRDTFPPGADAGALNSPSNQGEPAHGGPDPDSLSGSRPPPPGSPPSFNRPVSTNEYAMEGYNLGRPEAALTQDAPPDLAPETAVSVEGNSASDRPRYTGEGPDDPAVTPTPPVPPHEQTTTATNSSKTDYLTSNARRSERIEGAEKKEAEMKKKKADEMKKRAAEWKKRAAKQRHRPKSKRQTESNDDGGGEDDGEAVGGGGEEEGKEDDDDSEEVGGGDEEQGQGQEGENHDDDEEEEEEEEGDEGKMGSSVANAIVIDDSDLIVLDDSDEDDEEAHDIRNKRAEEKVLHEIGRSVEESPLVPHTMPPLSITPSSSRYSDTQSDLFPVYDLVGQRHDVKPELFNSVDYQCWKDVFKRSVDEYTDVQGTGTRRPQWLDDPQNSSICIVSAREFLKLGARGVQMRFNRCHIAIPKDPGAEGGTVIFSDGDSASKPFVRFSPPGLATVGDMFLPIHVHDQSIPVVKNNHQERVRTGNINQIYQATLAPPSLQKSLNALSFADHFAQVAATPYASDVRAIYRTGRDPGALASQPTGETRWTVLGTKGSHSYHHQDPRGEGTYLYPICGEKYWVIATPRKASDLSSTRVISDKNFNIMKLDPKKWKLEILYLRQGDKFIMQPATMHSALTKEHCILVGGHFLAVSTMARTIIGCVHTFFQWGVLTNTDHPSTLARIASMIAFFHKAIALGERIPGDEGHLPVIDSVESLQDMLLLACGIELSNATCTTSYSATADPLIISLLQVRHGREPDAKGPKKLGVAEFGFQTYDVSAMPYQVRCMLVYCRGRMQDLLRIILQQLEILDGEGNVIEDPWTTLFTPMLAWYIAGLRDYYKVSCREESNSLPDKVFFDRQVNWTIQRAAMLWPTLEGELAKLKGKKVTNFVLPLHASAVRPRSEHPRPDGQRSPVELFRAGLRHGDRAYLSVVMPSLIPTVDKRSRSPSSAYSPSKKQKRA